MKKRTAKVVWTGPGKNGRGKLSTGSEALNDMNYSFQSRFEDAPGTNPEELLAAAHGGCFSMKLSILLADKGYDSKSIETKCTVSLEGGVITHSHLDVNAFVESIQEEEFKTLVDDALANCPISKTLNIEKTVNFSLNKAGRNSE